MIDELKVIGLSEKEAKIYLSCLELGKNSAESIGRHSGYPKSSTYDCLIKLEQAGYINRVDRQFQAKDPIHLKQKIHQESQAVDKLLPELTAIHNINKNKPNIRSYYGKTGLEAVAREILNEANVILSIFPENQAFFKFYEYLPKFDRDRAQKGIPMKLITNESTLQQERQRLGSMELLQVKFAIPASLESVILIWKNKVAIMILREEISITVFEAKEVAATQKALFELLWGSV